MQNKHHILYSFRRCPYAMRARLALYMAGVPHEHREIVLRDKPAHMLEISPKGTVPVLLLADGTVVDESLDIMHEALRQAPQLGWFDGLDEGEKSETAKLIQTNDGAFKKSLDIYKYPNRVNGGIETAMQARSACEVFLQDLETRLQKSAYLLREEPTLADYALFPFIRQFSKVDEVWWQSADYPYLQKWLTAHMSSELFENIMEKRDPWKEGDDPIFLFV